MNEANGCPSAPLLADLRKLGVTAGDILFVHSSYRSLGPIEGGAATVISALQAACGPDGLLLMPSFNLVEPERRPQTWDLRTTPSTVGWLTEYFRQMPGTYRSDHYSHSVAACGSGARQFVSDHLCQDGMHSPWDRLPWGRTFGWHSPMYRAYEAGGKILMLGVDYDSSTYIHLVEVINWDQHLRQDSQAEYERFDRPRLGAFWDKTALLRRGKVGQADCRLFAIRPYIEALLREVRNNAKAYLRQ